MCLAWLAAILLIAAAITLPIPAAAGGRVVRRWLCTIASRGKTFRPSSFKARFTVPQKFFLHFYVEGVAVTTSLLFATWFYAYMKMTPLVLESSSSSTIDNHYVGGSSSFSLANAWPSHPVEHKYRVWRTVFVLILMEIQVLRRMYESKYVFHYSPTARMHIASYLVGWLYYVAAPLALASPCLPEAMRGQARIPDLVIDLSHIVMPLLKLGWCQWIGMAIFIWGWLHQFCCHAILGSLREHKNSDEYVIPCGDWFSYVSCPHYLAEIVMYFGLLIASGGSSSSVWFLLIFVILNLSFSAIQTHKWYLQKFEDYPRSRYAIVPYIC
ncbi:hypothetical protein HU200_063176 [Digitaria exilis]|uniref:3-oxo-5-alpha-steroid 4-dehydrogenase C-terminal domain-containing protein n=1 Tax=Digitaria exilis TaxID=1010633 RepID=A0A835DZ92_9POAL|nr:hypothetical protein HU200_063176 [Digitaria exilis]